MFPEKCIFPKKRRRKNKVPTYAYFDLHNGYLFKQNIFRDQKIIELLYAEAKYNVLQGRYPVEVNHCLMLASLQCRIELGPNNLQQYTSGFFR